jgi:hypothetical protein
MDVLSVALSGLVGVVFGSVVTLLDERRRQHRDEMGAARALYFEMTTNAVYMKNMAARNPLTDLSHSTWDATQSKVATLLSPGDLKVVAEAYAMLALCQGTVDAVRARGNLASINDLNVWAQGHNSFLDGVIVLRRTAWSKNDQKDLAKPRGAEETAPA